jgi:hypothetical protein
MGHPDYTLDRKVAAAPEAVLEAIRAAVAATRLTDLPPKVRKGARGLRGTVRRTRFKLWIEETFEGGMTDVRGWVLPDGSGGSRVRADADDNRFAGAAAGLLMAIALLCWLAGFRGAGLAALLGIILAVAAFIRRANGSIDHAHAAFLLVWLNGVLDRFPPADPVEENPETPAA